jgi:ribonuclease R
MIEEFMLAANEAVAAALKAALVPTIYRVHEEPDPSKLHTFALTARSYGIAAGALNSREELSRVAAAIKGHADEQILTVALLRSMMRARYATKALGHFGLAKGDYCHFTSPIRRYADLIVHRGFAKLAQGKHARTHLPAPGRLAEIAEHISETERNSAAAEKEAHQTKLALYLAAECESDSPRHWQAVITDT